MNQNADIPKQAVILAGGRGTRLKPLTDHLPKPMIAFNEKPFLEYLVDMLREQGIEKILLLLGYMPGTIRNHFGDGAAFGVHMEYSVTDVDHDTGMRMVLAKDLIDPCFLFMYCDNYWPMRFREMIEQYHQSKRLAQITVYRNQDGYSRDNVRVDEDRVASYDKTRTEPDLQGVEIGFAIMKKEVLDLLPEGNVNFEMEVFPQLVERGELSAFVTDHRYYSVGSHERLPLTEQFLLRKPAIILDRDGVLNEKPPKAHYVCEWEDFKWIPGSQEALRLLKEAGYTIILVTNQAGIARGIMTEDKLLEIHQNIKVELEASGGALDAIYFCPHGWDEGCECRKPQPGMLFQAQRDFQLDLSRIYFVGDDERDEQAGKAAGCPTHLVTHDRPLIDFVKEFLAR